LTVGKIDTELGLEGERCIKGRMCDR